LQRFTGKTAIVTGAGSGIGRASAVRLAQEGARVVAVDIVGERLDDLVKELPEREVVAVEADVGSEAPVPQIMRAAGGSVDVLVNVAGIMDGFLPVAEMDDETWERVFAVNVTAMMRLTRAVLPGMLERSRGAIVNVSSYGGFHGSVSGAAYIASKHAVIGLTRSTAFMYAANGIRANAVAPGGVVTNIEATPRSEHGGLMVMPILEHMMPESVAPETMAAPICWLASDDAENVTGIVLPADGGWTTK
jgi:NAD(P)-dependent dehydrogenase (short-subunit alcohol dehydrogenase family)